MLNGKNLDMLFVIGFFSLIIFTSWAILELRPSYLSIPVPLLLNIASATPVSNNTNINTTQSSNNATTTTIVEDSNGTITTIPELEDRRHVPLR